MSNNVVEYRQWVQENWSSGAIVRPAPLPMNVMPAIQPVVVKSAPTYASVAKHITLGKMSSDYLKNNNCLRGSKIDSESDFPLNNHSGKMVSNSSTRSLTSRCTTLNNNDCQMQRSLSTSRQLSSLTTQKSIHCGSEPNLHLTSCSSSNIKNQTINSSKGFPADTRKSNSLPSTRTAAESASGMFGPSPPAKGVTYSGVTKSNLKSTQVTNSRTASSGCMVVTEQTGVLLATKCKGAVAGSASSPVSRGTSAALPHSSPCLSVSLNKILPCNTCMIVSIDLYIIYSNYCRTIYFVIERKLVFAIVNDREVGFGTVRTKVLKMVYRHRRIHVD